MLQVGQLNKGGTRVTFKTNGNQTGMNTNPNYMKAWAEAANEMKDQGRSAVLDGFWPQIDSQEVISKHSPTKKKKRHEESTGRGDRSGRTRNVDDQNTSEIRRRTRKKIRYHREGTSRKSTSVTTLTDALGKTRMECNKVLVKANIAIEDSNRAANALVKHLHLHMAGPGKNLVQVYRT